MRIRRTGRLANPYTVPRCNGIKVPRVPSCKPTAATANEMKKDTDFSLQAMMLCDAATCSGSLAIEVERRFIRLGAEAGAQNTTLRNCSYTDQYYILFKLPLRIRRLHIFTIL